MTHGKGMQSYLTMMAVRLMEMRRLLKPTGSIYLHCDPTASHYLKLVDGRPFRCRQLSSARDNLGTDLGSHGRLPQPSVTMARHLSCSIRGPDSFINACSRIKSMTLHT